MRNIGFLFDLDGVLIDSEKEYTRIWDKIEEKYPTGKKDFANSIKGQTLTLILQENYNIETRELVTKELHRLEEEMTYTYCRGAEALLHRLHEANCNTAVVTSSDGKKMSHLFKDLPEFKNKVKVIIDAERVTRSKPDPEGYTLAAKDLDINIAKCVVFEDSVQGVRAGRASGAYVIGITGTKTREELIPYSDMVIDSLQEIDLANLSQILRER